MRVKMLDRDASFRKRFHSACNSGLPNSERVAALSSILTAERASPPATHLAPVHSQLPKLGWRLPSVSHRRTAPPVEGRATLRPPAPHRAERSSAWQSPA